MFRKFIRRYNDKIFTFFVYVIATFFLLISAYPLWFVVIASFSNMDAIIQGKVWIVPVDITFKGYQMMLEHTEIWSGYWNSIQYTAIGTTIAVCMTLVPGYVLSRPGLPFKKQITWYYMLTTFIGGGLIPFYMLIKNLHLYNTFAVMVVLGAVGIHNMIVCRTFFTQNIPQGLIEAAKMDGCSEFGIFVKIVLPMSKAIIAVITLYNAVGRWNNYRTGLIYLRDDTKYPLQLVLRNLLNSIRLEEVDDAALDALLEAQSMRYGVLIAASLPVLILYPFIQKHFVKGVNVGSIKE